ncbi:acyl-CoA thioesterase [Natrialbaceae archaeon GCM10025896]
MDVNYRDSTWVDDRVTVALVPSLGTTSVTYKVTRTVEGDLVFDRSVTTAFIDKGTHEPIPIPEAFGGAVEQF